MWLIMAIWVLYSCLVISWGTFFYEYPREIITMMRFRDDNDQLRVAQI